MMRADLRVRLADGTDVGYAEAGDPDGHPVLHLHGTPGSRLEVSIPAARRAAEDLGVRLICPDRPGVGLSPFRRFSIRQYPQLVRGFVAALGLERFAVTGVSSGGKYACACAWDLPDLVTRAVLASSTCPVDLPGAKATWSNDDRLVYTLANRAPWLLRLMFAKLTHDIQRDPTAIFPMMKGLGPADQDILGREAAGRRTTTGSKPGPGVCRSARSRCPSRSGTARTTGWCPRRRAGFLPPLSRVPPPTLCPARVTSSWPATTPKTPCDPPSAADTGERRSAFDRGGSLAADAPLPGMAGRALAPGWERVVA
jgi:pimeloyl-ACP methyl ester carboxylesterase